MSVYVYDPIEVTVREYLMSVQDAPVYVTAPKTLPSQFVQVTAVGGGEGVVAQRPMATFVCWAESRADAARFAETLIAHMRGCRRLGGLPVYRVRTIGLPTYRPDESGKHRYQFTLELHVRGRNFSPV